MAKVKKAQEGSWMSKETFNKRKFRPTDGAAYTTSHGKKTKFLSEDKEYSMKSKYNDENKPNKRTSLVERRTVKGFLKGAPKAAGKATLDERGNMKNPMKGGGKITKAKSVAKMVRKSVKKK